MAPLAYHSLKDGVVGREFKQLFQHYPVLEPFYFEFEKNFHAEKYVNFAKANWQVPLAFIGVYILMIAVVPKLMAKREKGLNLKLPFAYWNLCLSLFSFCGMIRTAPHLVYNITHAKSFRDTICTPAEVSYGEGACGLWVMLFIFSKIPELGDTAFIVFKKSVSPLICAPWKEMLLPICPHRLRPGCLTHVMCLLLTCLVSSRSLISSSGTTTSPCFCSAGTRTPTPPQPACTSWR